MTTTTLFVLLFLFAGGVFIAPNDNSTWDHVRQALAPWLPFANVLIGGAVGQVRAFTPKDGFWHNRLGHALLALFAAALGSLSGVITDGSLWSMSALIGVLAAGSAAFFSALKPIGKAPSSSTPPPIPVQRVGAMLPFLFLTAISLSACAHVPGQPPTPSQQYLDAFGTCMEGQGMSALSATGVQVWNILEQPGATQAEIVKRFEALGIAAASAAIQAAALCAVSAWAGLHPMAEAEQPTQAQAAVRVIRARHVMPKPTTRAP